MDYSLLSGLTLAYMGDSIYETYIRKYLISTGLTKINILNKKCVEFTSGKAQADILYYLINNNILLEEEINIYKRGRNSHVSTVRKNIDIKTYLDATGFESIFGYLYLKNDINRLEDLIKIIIEYKTKATSL